MLSKCLGKRGPNKGCIIQLGREEAGTGQLSLKKAFLHLITSSLTSCKTQIAPILSLRTCLCMNDSIVCSLPRRLANRVSQNLSDFKDTLQIFCSLMWRVTPATRLCIAYTLPIHCMSCRYYSHLSQVLPAISACITYNLHVWNR